MIMLNEKRTIKRNYPVPALDKMNAIFLYLQKVRKPAGLTEISRETKIPKTTCMRILNTLEKHSYLFKEYDRSVFSLGIKLFSLGQSVGQTLAWTKVLESQLSEFTKKIKEGIKISALIDNQVTVIFKAETNLPMKLSMSTGLIEPIHAGAASKVLLSQLSDAEWPELVELPLRRYTSNTIITKKGLRKELSKIREKGYGVDNEEFMEGVVAVAVPLLLPGNIAALSVPFIKQSKNTVDKINFLKNELKKKAEILEKFLSDFKYSEIEKK